MGEARRRSVNGNSLLIPDKTLVAPNGAPLSAATVHEAVARMDYGLVLLENGTVVKQQPIPDPFVRVELVVKGWRKAWAVLMGRYRVEVHVLGDEHAMRNVFGSDAAIRR